MIISTDILVRSKWGITVRNQLLTQSEAKGLAVFMPGRGYPGEGPLLYYARLVALEAGLNCLNVNYGFFGAGAAISNEELDDVFAESLEAVDKTGQIPDFMVGKSLGTVIIGEICAQKNWQPRCMWLTPLEHTMPHIKRLGGMVVYGTKDIHFPSIVADSLSGLSNITVNAINGANHSLTIPGNWQASMKTLKDIAGMAAEFFAL